MSDLRKWVSPNVDNARLARQWSAITSQSRSSSRYALAIALVLAAGFAAFLFFPRHPASPVSTAASPADRTIVLDDGSRVVPEGRADVSVSARRVELRSGAIELDVKHDPARPFVVAAGAVTIVDIGTRFRVELDRDVRVIVREGAVRVEGPSFAATELQAGDMWTSAKAHALEPAPTASAAPVVTQVVPRAPTPAEEAKKLFEAGDAARLANQPEQAARSFDALRTRYRTDPRAGLAAMELGRLRQAVLHDPRGADEAVRDAIELAPDAPFREDAEARRVAVLDTLGDRSACVAARDAYLAHHPTGLHASTVSRRCAER